MTWKCLVSRFGEEWTQGNEFLFLFLNFDTIFSASTARATHQLRNNCIPCNNYCWRREIDHFAFETGKWGRRFWEITSGWGALLKHPNRLIKQQNGNVSWRRRAQIKQLAWPMAERQIGHRKSCLVLSARFPVVNWRSRPVAKSAYLINRSGKKKVNSKSHIYGKKLGKNSQPLISPIRWVPILWKIK